jgi:hypothetical protein
VKEMPSTEEYELSVRNELAANIVELNKLEEALREAAAAPKQRTPAQLKNIMKQVSEVFGECEQIVEQHADETIPVSNDLLKVVASAIRAAHEVLSGVVLLEALRPLRP